MQDFSGNLIETLSRLAFPKIGIIDIIQIALIAFFVYQFMVWIKYTHAYTLLKGILVVLLFILIAYIFRMNTILWIFSNLASTLIVGVIVIFQPELRKVLEQLGQKRIMASPQIMKYIVTKGSVTVDGISLTVAKVSETDFSISAIPHTVKITVLGERKEGDIVNLETDIIGKYVEKLITPVKEQPIKSNITRDFLNKYGF